MSIIDQIDLSLDKASSLQQKRIEAEEQKQKSLNFEIDQLRNQLDGSQIDDYENQYTPEKSHSLSQYSPLRNDIKNLELQNQLLASSEKKLKKELDVSDNENDSEILPKYEYQQKGKAPSRKLSEPKQKPKLAASQQKGVKQKTQQKTIPKTTQIITKVEKKPEKENYVIQEQRQDYVQLQKHIKNVKETVSNQLTKKEILKKETQQDNEQTYKIRGYRDQAEIKYFGRPLPCNECVFLLNKGMSSDFCSQHGKICKEKPQSKQLPKRLAKYF